MWLILAAWPLRRDGAEIARRRVRSIVLETVKGTIEFETYPEEAPKTVARIVELVKKASTTDSGSTAPTPTS